MIPALEVVPQDSPDLLPEDCWKQFWRMPPKLTTNTIGRVPKKNLARAKIAANFNDATDLQEEYDAFKQN